MRIALWHGEVMNRPDSPIDTASEYSLDPDNQLQPADTLIDRGVDDVLDEGYSPPERPYAGAFDVEHKSLDQLLAEEEPDPARRLDASEPVAWSRRTGGLART